MAKRAAPTIGDKVFRDSAIEATEGDDRVVRFVMSDETPDRMGDVISADGWLFDNFWTNPIVLWGHNSRELPIGIVQGITRDGTKTLGDVKFHTADMNPFADTVFKMVKAGAIRACSVGFRALALEPIMVEGDSWPTGYKFTSQELLELSVVSIPALPTALAVAKSLDVPEMDFRRLFDSMGACALAERQRDLRTIELRGLQ